MGNSTETAVKGELIILKVDLRQFVWSTERLNNEEFLRLYMGTAAWSGGDKARKTNGKTWTKLFNEWGGGAGNVIFSKGFYYYLLEGFTRGLAVEVRWMSLKEV